MWLNENIFKVIKIKVTSGASFVTIRKKKVHQINLKLWSKKVSQILKYTRILYYSVLFGGILYRY